MLQINPRDAFSRETQGNVRSRPTSAARSTLPAAKIPLVDPARQESAAMEKLCTLLGRLFERQVLQAM